MSYKTIFKEYEKLEGIKLIMKNSMKKEEYKITFLYGGVLFLVGITGMIFPSTAKYIATFCFIYGGSSLLVGLLYFVTYRNEVQSKENKKIK